MRRERKIIRLEKGNEEYGWDKLLFSYLPDGKIDRFSENRQTFSFLYPDHHHLTIQKTEGEPTFFELSENKIIRISGPEGESTIQYQDQKVIHIKHQRKQGDIYETFGYSSEGYLTRYTWEKEQEVIQKMFTDHKAFNRTYPDIFPWLIDFESDWTFLFPFATGNPFYLPAHIFTSIQNHGKEMDHSETALSYILQEDYLKQILFKKKQQLYWQIKLFYENLR